MPEPYKSRFEVGDEVRIESSEFLTRFAKEWRFHNPLAPEQLPFAGRVARVRDVGFYHGGDALYVLDGVPGVWHDECLAKP